MSTHPPDPPAVLACCRASVGEADILRIWLQHYAPADARLVLVVAEPGQDESEVSALVAMVEGAGASCVIHRAEGFSCPGSMEALGEAVARYPARWVLHTDSDEFLYEVGDLPGIVARMEEGGHGYAMAWMADRTAPLGKLAPMDGVETYGDLEKRYPVRCALTRGLLGANDGKAVLLRWPSVGAIHRPHPGAGSPGPRLTVEHFKWRAGLRERLVKRVADHKREGLPWGQESVRVLEELDRHGRVRCENHLVGKGARFHGWFDYQRIYLSAMRWAKPGDTYVEVGVWQGRSLCYLAEAAVALGKAGKVRIDGVDPFRNFPGGKTGYPKELYEAVTHGSWIERTANNLRSAGVLDHVNLIQCPSPEAARLYEDGSLQFVWIDGAHDAASVEADCRAWWPKVKWGGVMAGHDYWQAGVKRGVANARLKHAHIRPRGNAFVAKKHR